MKLRMRALNSNETLIENPNDGSASETLVSNSQSSIQMEPGNNLGRAHCKTLAVEDFIPPNHDTLDKESVEGKIMGDGSNLQSEESEEGFGAESMETDGTSVGFLESKFPESCFVRRVRMVLNEGLAGEDDQDHKLMMIAVHSVLLESGFVGFDLVSGTRVDRFNLLDNWRPSMAFTLSFHYTLPEILSNQGSSLNVVETVVLKFQIMGRFVNVFGSLNGSDSRNYRVCLDERRFVPIIGSVQSPNSGSRIEVYDLLKIVKDGLALHLLIDLCAKAGLPSPPCCFMGLPSELQTKVLEFLPGVEIAKIGCVSKELHYLSCSDDLWKRKFEQEFGSQRRILEAAAAWTRKKAFAYYYQQSRLELEQAARAKRLRLLSSIPTMAPHIPTIAPHMPITAPRIPRTAGRTHFNSEDSFLARWLS